jgi:hypothetical protein
LDEPIACTLTDAELHARQDRLLPGLVRRAASVELRGDSCELRFASEPGILMLIGEVIEAEGRCCRFFRFELNVESLDGPISLRISGPAGTRAVLQELLDHAERRT